jgi:hypothetical protein
MNTNTDSGIPSTATPVASVTQQQAPAELAALVAQWEGGVTRTASYQKDQGETLVHVALTARGTYWVLRYFQIGGKWMVSADASDTDLKGVLKALEITFC